ncbi:glycosyltransferase [Dichelobacter nodosus]|uniref:Uncharacterized protein n=1 Tax=Dichelobacter nodosus (strain VCS1703A) TaxID=246195 RepID=A5EVE7_DICNV|nr:hypothetical protein [Dichelobacter nodosus]ABQ13527.1 conserved hypothetical protein [Dichelobacter nodosus VCS1703A]AXM45462.1 hypothetical protein DYQ38_02910 [Dichelobacter nodosus]KNZ39832.1 hypothetical protein AKG33_01410 [Dichelobacter nodosus]TGA66656.1 hypothetical protein E5E99_00515 [Dichelobacter nodosus]
MKTLLIESVEHPSLTQIHDGLRHATGTCEVYTLTSDHLENMERFFQRFIRLEQYDRIVLQLSQQIIYEQSPFLRQLPYICFLSFNEVFTSADRHRLMQNMNVMPWARLISDDFSIIKWQMECGHDAHWLKPIYNPSTYPLPRKPSAELTCYIYEPSGRFYEMRGRQLSAMAMKTLEIADVGDELALLGNGDLFVCLPEYIEDSSRLIIRAMAYGAVVITLDPGSEQRLRYGWQNTRNCIFVSKVEEIIPMLGVLSDQKETRLEIAAEAKKHIENFYPFTVGQMLGAVLLKPIRKAADYPRKTRVFGFEI